MNRSTSQSRVKGARATSASRSTSIKTMDARPPQMTTVANNDPTASSNSAGSAGKKIRSSIDLELQLGFDSSSNSNRCREMRRLMLDPKMRIGRRSLGVHSLAVFHGICGAGGDNIPLPASAKRPMGPRSLDIGSQVQMASVGKTTLPRNYANQQGGESMDPSASLSVTVWYFQLRVWVFLMIFVASALGAAIVGGLSANILAPPRLTSNFFIFTACATLLVALATLLLFILRGSTMMYHYDAPFLLLFSSSNNNNQQDRSLAKRDAITVWVDIGFHTLLLMFWVATLADLGVKIGGCRTGALVLRTDSSACTGFEAGLGLGVVVLIAEVFVLGMKAWEVYGNLALIRKAI
ncbi:hypothetical protein BJ741DRAFT_624089 [Chytriomyces cf. hyalinus JEL632]|nr:hypothetical protein BJ741DRAFT_624089 [Chytriomyces cf. hyalinus JEL632]